mmetsp:Transcript_27340/g.88320  ORF Transcript_27340/g.88320 Transcript_27340/m.88320 type:complete len:220 (-) Transcript_27340:426-1085(-)
MRSKRSSPFFFFFFFPVVPLSLSATFSSKLSTAALLGAAARTLVFPSLTSLAIAAATVVVLPVPGGPWTRHTGDPRQINATASRCDSFSDDDDRGSLFSSFSSKKPLLLSPSFASSSSAFERSAPPPLKSNARRRGHSVRRRCWSFRRVLVRAAWVASFGRRSNLSDFSPRASISERSASKRRWILSTSTLETIPGTPPPGLLLLLLDRKVTSLRGPSL